MLFNWFSLFPISDYIITLSGGTTRRKREESVRKATLKVLHIARFRTDDVVPCPCLRKRAEKWNKNIFSIACMVQEVPTAACGPSKVRKLRSPYKNTSISCIFLLFFSIPSRHYLFFKLSPKGNKLLIISMYTISNRLLLIGLNCSSPF